MRMLFLNIMTWGRLAQMLEQLQDSMTVCRQYFTVSTAYTHAHPATPSWEQLLSLTSLCLTNMRSQDKVMISLVVCEHAAIQPLPFSESQSILSVCCHFLLSFMGPKTVFWVYSCIWQLHILTITYFCGFDGLADLNKFRFITSCVPCQSPYFLESLSSCISVFTGL